VLEDEQNVEVLMEDHTRVCGSALFGRSLGNISGYCDWRFLWSNSVHPDRCKDSTLHLSWFTDGLFKVTQVNVKVVAPL